VRINSKRKRASLFKENNFQKKVLSIYSNKKKRKSKSSENLSYMSRTGCNLI